MPLGMKSEDNETKVVKVSLTAKELMNRLLAATFASTTEDLIVTNVAGFVLVTDVNLEQQKITVLSPQPKPLPDTLFILSDIQFVDTS